MTEPLLHAFDHALCDHVLVMTRGAAANNSTFATFVARTVPERILRGGAADLLPVADDLQTLERSSAFIVRYPWAPNISLYEGWIDCLGDVSQLGDVVTADWRDHSLGCVEELTRRDQSYFGGIQAIREWLKVIRALLRSLKRAELVPRPGGGHPSWREPAPVLPSPQILNEGSNAVVSPDVAVQTAIAPQMLTVKQVAARLNVDKRTVYRLRDAGKMPPPVKIRGCLRWHHEEIESWIAGRCPGGRELRRPR